MKLSVFYHHILEAAKQSGSTVEDVIAYVVSLGINYVELDINDASDEVFKCLSKSGLGISSIYGFYDFGKSLDIKSSFLHIDKAVNMNCGKIMIIPGFYSSNDEIIQYNERKNMLEAMTEMCDYAVTKGVIPTIEDFDDASSPIAAAEGMLWFAQRIPQLGITFDTGNFMYSEQSELDAFELLKSRIVHVHCKDRSLEYKAGCEIKKTVRGRKMYPSAVGYGCINMSKIVASLEKSGYNGIYTIEHFGSDNQLQYMKLSAEWLKGFNK